MAEHTVVAQQRGEQRIKMSYEDYLATVDDSIHSEWVNGEAIFFMPPHDPHQDVVGFLHALIRFFASILKLGKVRAAPFEMLIAEGGPSREPDILFIAEENMGRLTKERVVGPADFVVEVISHDSTSRDRSDKFYEYQEGGVREYLIVDPRAGKERIDWYALQADGRYQAILPDEAGRYRSVVLPGFWLRAEWLREGQLPEPLPILVEICKASPEAAKALRETFGGV